MAKSGRFKGYFFRGLAVLLPTVVTIWIFVWGYNFIYKNIAVYVKFGLIWAIDRVTTMEPKLSELLTPANGEQLDISMKYISAILSVAGFLIALGAVFIIGALLASVVGRAIWGQVEKFIMNTPLLKQIYPYVKQITDFFLKREEKQKMFSRVVAVEYPRKGIWSMALVTGKGLRKIVNNVQKEFLTLLIPTSPTPFTGFVIMVPKEDTIELDMTIEEALRFAVSAGVIAPSALRVGGGVLDGVRNKGQIEGQTSE